MSRTQSSRKRGIANNSRHNPFEGGSRSTKDAALSDREFQLLLEGAREMKPYYAQQARFAILLMGRLGLRRGELAHMQSSWLDTRRNMIVIPRHQPCLKAQGEQAPCGYCRRLAEMRVDHNEELSMEEALADTWKPKTEAGAREVPYDFDPRCSLVLERFFEKYDEWPCSCQAVNRRVKRAAEHAVELEREDVFPHCLRGTAASYHAGRGLGIFPLQAMFGWACLSTAMSYVASSGENTARALHMTHSR